MCDEYNSPPIGVVTERLHLVRYVFEARPTKTGWYWMKSRNKWGKIDRHEPVWFSEDNEDQVRVGDMWKFISQIHKASFARIPDPE